MVTEDRRGGGSSGWCTLGAGGTCSRCCSGSGSGSSGQDQPRVPHAIAVLPLSPASGWRFDAGGGCTKMPSTTFCKGIKVQSLPVVEAGGLVWVWPGSQEAHAAAGPPPATLAAPPEGFQASSGAAGDEEAGSAAWGFGGGLRRLLSMPPPVPSRAWFCCSSHTCTCNKPSMCVPLPLNPSPKQVHAELVLDVPVEHGLLLENLLDLAHAPFTHTTTFAKGWPVPGAAGGRATTWPGGGRGLRVPRAPACTLWPACPPSRTWRAPAMPCSSAPCMHQQRVNARRRCGALQRRPAAGGQLGAVPHRHGVWAALHGAVDHR